MRLAAWRNALRLLAPYALSCGKAGATELRSRRFV
jgi:hypothetical protein